MGSGGQRLELILTWICHFCVRWLCRERHQTAAPDPWGLPCSPGGTARWQHPGFEQCLLQNVNISADSTQGLNNRVFTSKCQHFCWPHPGFEQDVYFKMSTFPLTQWQHPGLEQGVRFKICQHFCRQHPGFEQDFYFKICKHLCWEHPGFEQGFTSTFVNISADNTLGLKQGLYLKICQFFCRHLRLNRILLQNL